MPTISRKEYVGLFGPTTGDRIRLGDTGLFVEIERDLRGGYGDEIVFGGGKSMREGMGMDNRVTRAGGAPDLVITNVTIIDAVLLEEHGVEFSGFLTATLAALLVGKAVLVTDKIPFMRRFDGAPMIQPILFKSAIYWLCVLMVRLAERLGPFFVPGRGVAQFSTPPN